MSSLAGSREHLSSPCQSLTCQHIPGGWHPLTVPLSAVGPLQAEGSHRSVGTRRWDYCPGPGVLSGLAGPQLVSSSGGVWNAGSQRTQKDRIKAGGVQETAKSSPSQTQAPQLGRLRDPVGMELAGNQGLPSREQPPTGSLTGACFRPPGQGHPPAVRDWPHHLVLPHQGTSHFEALAPGFPNRPRPSRGLCWGHPSSGSVPANNNHTDPAGGPRGRRFTKEAAFSCGILNGFKPSSETFV